MVAKDISQRFILEHSNIRGELTRLQESYKQVIENGDYHPAVKNLLGELMAASVLLSSTLKFEGQLSIQARGDGYLKMIMAECRNDKRIRAIAHVDKNQQPPKVSETNLGKLLGKGQLAITIQPDKGKQYQGVVPLGNDSIASSIENYFKRSEQIPTRLFLFCQLGRAGGMLLQMLPQQNSLENTAQGPELWDRTCALANTLSSEELLAMPSARMLHRLYNGDEVRLLNETPVLFECRCSQERTQRALLALHSDELKEILSSKESVSVQCQFCGTDYEFSKHEIENLLNPRAQQDGTGSLLH